MARTSDLMRVLGVCRPTAIDLMRAGEIPGAKLIGSRWYVPWETLEFITDANLVRSRSRRSLST